VSAPARLEACFAALRAERKKALVAYLCVGDPSLDASVELAVAAVEAGADILELGTPFSDPTADGPAIARASQRALRNGATLLGVLDVARRVRARVDAPIVLFGYVNPIEVTGAERVVRLAADAGIDALLVVDLPPEEAAGLRGLAASAGLALIPLIAPTTDAARASVIIGAAGGDGSGPRGFVYYVSVTGVTGSGEADFGLASREAEALRTRFGLPVVVGFGIDGPDAARRAAGPRGGGADGVVVGTALVKRVEAGESQETRVAGVRELTRSLRAALDAP
jgi:tryptophan synthase alpha chain